MIHTQPDLQSSRVSCCALALSRLVMTDSSVLALAFLLTAISIGAHFTLGLTAPASVPGSADARPDDGVTQRSILALASVTAVWTPVVTVTSYGKHKMFCKIQYEMQPLSSILSPFHTLTGDM